MRNPTPLLLVLTGCAAATGSNPRVEADLEVLKGSHATMAAELQKMRADMDALREELVTLRTRQEMLASKVDSVRAPPRQRGPEAGKIYAVDPGDSPARGGAPSQAWVTIVEFSDFQCPFCQRVQETLSYLLAKYGDAIRVVYKHNPLPFHAQALPAAIASVCAHEQDRFWRMHDTIFGRVTAIEADDLERYARDLQLDTQRWKTCVAGGAARARVEQEVAMAARFGARGTPSFFINGRYLSGAQPAESFVTVIDAELDKARASGVPAAQYYERVVLGTGAKAAD